MCEAKSVEPVLFFWKHFLYVKKRIKKSGDHWKWGCLCMMRWLSGYFLMNLISVFVYQLVESKFMTACISPASERLIHSWPAKHSEKINEGSESTLQWKALCKANVVRNGKIRKLRRSKNFSSS